jgi:hypothetical protein
MIYIALSKHHIRYYIVIYDKYHISMILCVWTIIISMAVSRRADPKRWLSRISRLQQGCFEKMPEMEAA